MCTFDLNLGQSGLYLGFFVWGGGESTLKIFLEPRRDGKNFLGLLGGHAPLENVEKIVLRIG